jgi:hypothetical protein
MSQQFHHLTWITDIHRNSFGEGDRRQADYQQAVENVRRTNPDAVLLNTDFAKASELMQYLEQLQYDLDGCPLYFTLGNHTHRNSIHHIRRQINKYCAGRTITHVGNCEEPVPLTDSIALVGYDGWTDTRFGETTPSLFSTTLSAINEFLGDPKAQKRQGQLNAAAHKSARRLKSLLSQALRRYPNVILLTQLPIWTHLLHDQRQCPSIPPLVSPTAGEVVEPVMKSLPDRKLAILSGGHADVLGSYPQLRNVHAVIGQAVGAPAGVRFVISSQSRAIPAEWELTNGLDMYSEWCW